MLTQKQEAFCLAYVETGNASMAYRAAYNAENMKDESVRVNASKLLADDNISLRINEIRAPVRERVGITLENHLRELETLRELAKAESKYAAAIAAETNRGKASGLYVEKHIHSGDAENPIKIEVDTSAAMKALEAKLAALAK